MTRGAKLFLAIGGVLGTIGVVMLAAPKKASAAPDDVKPPLPTEGEPETPPAGGVVVVPPDGPDEPDAPPVVVPAPVDSGVNVNEVARLLLRWWSTEGDSLFGADAVPSATVLEGMGFPRDWGSTSTDLGSSVTPRHEWMAKAYRFLVGLTDATTIPATSGKIDAALLASLRKWAKSQELPAAIPPINASTPAPIIVTDPAAPASPPIVLVPTPSAPPFVPPLPSTPAPTVPASFPLPPQSGPPPFVPPLPQAQPAAPTPPASAPLPELPAVLPSAPVSPPAPAAEQPALVPADTARLVAYLLKAEASNGWKKDKDPEVMAWQKSRGLVQDGKFGPKSAITVAQEIGTVPIVRFWPSGSFKEGKWLPEFRAALLTLANAASEPRASQLRHSAEREQGQGFGSNQKALPPALLINLAQVA